MLEFGILGVAIISATGCASIVSGRTQEMTFISDPPGAFVIIDGP